MEMDSKEPVKGRESLIQVACCQFEPRFGEKLVNLKSTLALIDEAAAAGARLILLPELCNTGYVFQTRQEAYSLAESIPAGETVTAWMNAAQRYQAYIVAGICERDGDNLYNSAVIIGPEGYIGTYRKLHLWGEEKLFFAAGNAGIPVFDTPIGRIAALICYDLWFPEAVRSCVVKQADIVCIPTNWVPIRGHNAQPFPLAVHLCITNAHVNGLFIAAADRIGTERNQPFLGHSVIVHPSGSTAAGPASGDQQEILLSQCNLSDARRIKHLNEFNHVLYDRRVDVYD